MILDSSGILYIVNYPQLGLITSFRIKDTIALDVINIAI